MTREAHEIERSADLVVNICKAARRIYGHELDPKLRGIIGKMGEQAQQLYAEAIDAYIVQHKLAPAVLIGHSLGGTISLYLAEHHPEHLRKVLLVDALPLYALALTGGRPLSAEQLHGIAQGVTQATLAASQEDYEKALKPQMASMATAPADVDKVMGWGLASDRSVVARAVGEDIDTVNR